MGIPRTRDTTVPEEREIIMSYNSNTNRRHSIRLKEWDYSQEGYYFITICTKNRECILGEIIENEMQLNEMGKII